MSGNEIKLNLNQSVHYVRREVNFCLNASHSAVNGEIKLDQKLNIWAVV
jgi:hypothetical protein